MISEPENWHVSVMVGNDTLRNATGTFRVWDADTDETLAEGLFTAIANTTEEITKIRISHGDQRMFLIEWCIDGTRYVNHYVLGKPPLSFERYNSWLSNIAAGDGIFSAEEIGI